MRRSILLLAGLLTAAPLLSQSLLLVDSSASTSLIDPASLKALPASGLDGLALCPSADGRGLWLSPQGRPREVELRSAQSGALLAGPLVLPGALLLKAVAVDPSHRRLWLGYEALNAQGGLDHGLALVDLASATLAAFARVEGEPQALALLAAQDGRPEQLLLAMALPSPEQGALLALAPDLSRVLKSLDLASRPDALRLAELQAPAASPAPAAAGPASTRPSAEAQGNSSSAKGFKSPFQALKGAFFGQVHDASGAAVAGARVRALNRRGQAVEAVAGDDGRYSLGPLSFGAYQLVAEKEGFRKRILSEQLLLENARQLDLVLEPQE
jgi:hypothetical protein